SAQAPQRPAPLLHKARARRLSRDHAVRAGPVPRPPLGALVPARPRLGRAACRRCARGPFPRDRRAERRRPGHLRHRVPTRLRTRSAAGRAGRRARARDARALDRPRARRERPRAHRRDTDARARGRALAVGVPGGRHARRHEVRRARIPPQGEAMSYTLSGRLETRLVAVLAPLLGPAASSAVTTDWWPLELAGLMIGVGVALDLLIYHRLLPYQPGWLSVPLGLVELGAIMALVLGLHVRAPLGAAIAFFALS